MNLKEVRLVASCFILVILIHGLNHNLILPTETSGFNLIQVLLDCFHVSTGLAYLQHQEMSLKFFNMFPFINSSVFVCSMLKHTRHQIHCNNPSDTKETFFHYNYANKAIIITPGTIKYCSTSSLSAVL